jgi:hypothetical protein
MHYARTRPTRTLASSRDPTAMPRIPAHRTPLVPTSHRDRLPRSYLRYRPSFQVRSFLRSSRGQRSTR